jgi:hypothetical protein
MHLGLLETQIHKDLGIPFFADHIGALTESFDSGLVGTWKTFMPMEGCQKSPMIN